MEYENVVRRRRMVRAYTDQQVSEEQVENLLRLAHQAPSAGFKQGQEYIVVRDQGVKDALVGAAIGQDFIADAPVVIVVCVDTQRLAERYGDRGTDMYSLIDGAFAAMLILLGVVDAELGCCFVGAFDDQSVADVLGLPDSVIPVGIMPIGYPAEPPRSLHRRSLETIVHRDRWGG